MSYSLGTGPIEPTPEMARWHKMTPDLVSAWRAAYPSDRGIAEVLRRTVYGPVYVGIADDNLYYISGRNAAGDIGGQYAVLQGQPQMTYEQVLRVFEPTASGPDTKFKPFSIADERPVAAPDRTGLYVALGIAGAALLAGGVYLATRKKAPAALAANRRRTKRLAANSSFGPERDRVAARARAAFARGDTASARRALAELSSIDLALMPKALRRNDRRRAKRRTSALVKNRNGRARQ